MATCKICGFEDEKLPDNWINWQCRRCDMDERRTCTHYWHKQETEKSLEHEIRAIINDLAVPYHLIESAVKEGFTAYSERRDIREAIRYFVECEQ